MYRVLLVLMQEKNLWETISEGFKRGGSDKTKFLIIYFSTVLFGSILFYGLYRRIKRRIEVVRYERELFDMLCSVNGLTHNESKIVKYMMKNIKNSNKFSIFVSRKTFESFEAEIVDDNLKQTIMNKLFKPDDKGPAS